MSQRIKWCTSLGHVIAIVSVNVSCNDYAKNRQKRNVFPKYPSTLYGLQAVNILIEKSSKKKTSYAPSRPPSIFLPSSFSHHQSLNVNRITYIFSLLFYFFYTQSRNPLFRVCVRQIIAKCKHEKGVELK